MGKSYMRRVYFYLNLTDMAKVSYKLFRGKQPQVAPQLLQAGQAQTAMNCKLASGELRPWDNEQHVETLEGRTTIQTIYYYLSSYWFEFTADVDIVESPVVGDMAYRRYYTGNGIPKKTNQTEATTGAGAYPINYYPLQVPIPTHAPTAGAPGAGGSGDARDVNYVWTVVTSWGEESSPSDPSNTVSPMQGQSVGLTGMTLVWQLSQAYTVDNWVIPTALGDYVYKCTTAGTSAGVEPDWSQCVTIGDTITDGTITWTCVDKGILYDSGGVKNIYRTNIGDTSAAWQLLVSIGMAATTYTDTTSDDDLEATILPSSTWSSPPEALTGLVALSSGALAGFVGKDVYLSEPYYPHAWPYRKTFESTVIALAAIGNTLAVITDKYPEYYYGTHPDSMTVKKLPDPRACSSKRGVVNFPGGVLYPSEFGYEWLDGTIRKTITEGYFTKKEWADYYPGTLNATYVDGKLFAFYSSGGNEGGIVIDLATSIITDLDFYSSAIYVDPSTETLYYVKEKTVIILLDSATVSLQNGDPKTTVYTVPAGKKAVITHVIIRSPSGSLAGGTDFDIGSGALCDTWKQANSLASMTATTDYMVITSENTKYTLEAAAATFGILPITGATADVTATMEVFGYEI